MWLVRRTISADRNLISSAMVVVRSYNVEEHLVVVIRNAVVRHNAER